MTVEDERAAATPAVEAPPSAVVPATAFRVQDLGRTGVLAVVWTIMPALSTIFLVAYLGDLSDWFVAQGANGPLLYGAAFAIVAGLGFAPTYSLSFLAGWAFGFGVGTTTALGALLGAALVGFVVAHLVSSAHARSLIGRYPKAEAIRRALVGRGAWRSAGVVALLRVPPNSPFSLTNLVLGASGVGALPYVFGSLAGLAPRTAIYVGLGAAAAADGAQDLGEALSNGPGWPVVVGGIVVVLVVLNLIGKIAQRALESITAEDLAAAGAEQRDGGEPS
ncbi:SNARE associated Golgi protein [Planctomycetes bacterium Pla163]|uniref:TVP38/TMEM64 family membrane protein n=1 Tax=Rohdeia mirabilis TaxID=2528008 RepID=A0A518CY75_9BACT|nr:SNARE associated Golgi protein [Planctomycetes bacterium Pla163]